VHNATGCLAWLDCSYYGDQQEFRLRMEPKGSFSLRGAKAELNDAENKGLPVPKAFVIRCEVRALSNDRRPRLLFARCHALNLLAATLIVRSDCLIATLWASNLTYLLLP
jgi:hypothetical protein